MPGQRNNQPTPTSSQLMVISSKTHFFKSKEKVGCSVHHTRQFMLEYHREGGGEGETTTIIKSRRWIILAGRIQTKADFLAVCQACNFTFPPNPGLNERSFESSGLSAKWTLLPPPAVPHRRRSLFRKKDSERHLPKLTISFLFYKGDCNLY